MVAIEDLDLEGTKQCDSDTKCSLCFMAVSCQPLNVWNVLCYLKWFRMGGETLICFGCFYGNVWILSRNLTVFWEETKLTFLKCFHNLKLVFPAVDNELDLYSLIFIQTKHMVYVRKTKYSNSAFTLHWVIDQTWERASELVARPTAVFTRVEESLF